MDLSELQALRIQELAEMAKSLKILDDISGLNKQELTVKILEAQAEKDGSVFAKGILEVMHLLGILALLFHLDYMRTQSVKN